MGEIQMDSQHISNNASSFFMAAERCLEKRLLSTGEFHMPIVPAIVCAAFSTELFLKSILLKEGIAAKGHELLKLHNKLSESSRNYLAAETSLTEHDLRQNVGSISSTFVDWRYIYEKQYAKVNSEFLLKYCEVLKKLSSTM